jgi:hypothetical protein
MASAPHRRGDFTLPNIKGMDMFDKPLMAALVCALLVAPASAQTYKDSGGTIMPGVIPLPFSYTPLAPGQHNLAPVSPTSLTPPVGARLATICASAAAVKYTTDGVTLPSASIGQPLSAGACVSLSGQAVIANFLAISGTGTLDVEYFR